MTSSRAGHFYFLGGCTRVFCGRRMVYGAAAGNFWFAAGIYWFVAGIYWSSINLCAINGHFLHSPLPLCCKNACFLHKHFPLGAFCVINGDFLHTTNTLCAEKGLFSAHKGRYSPEKRLNAITHAKHQHALPPPHSTPWHIGRADVLPKLTDIIMAKRMRSILI